MDLNDVLSCMMRGGWPETQDMDEADAAVWMRQYVDDIAYVDFPKIGPIHRNVERIWMLLRSYSCATSMERPLLNITRDAGGLSYTTTRVLMEGFCKLMIADDLSPWAPPLNL